MLELVSQQKDTYTRSFAGDVYNTAVYMKRLFSGFDVNFMTAIGIDDISCTMLSAFEQEQLNNQYVYQHSTKTIGAYLVQTDAEGERSFTYWRSDAAARQCMQHLDAGVVKSLTGADVFFYSGITVAVLMPEQRAQFWNMLTKLRQAGVTIAFDPNYRPRLWADKEEAQEAIGHALALADIVLPGVDDFEQLFGVSSAQAVIEFCKPLGIDEVVVKNGAEQVIVYRDEKQQPFDVPTVDNVVDTTSAGDAFNGAYLGARITGRPVAEAVSLGCKASGFVIQCPGAIAPASEFAGAMLT